MEAIFENWKIYWFGSYGVHDRGDMEYKNYISGGVDVLIEDAN
jgi:hypothetical protein